MTADLTPLFILLIAYQFKHFFADYPLQNSYMLAKFKPDFKDFFLPLLAHSGVHALFTLILCLWYATSVNKVPDLLIMQLVITDLVVHFVMDRIKAGPKYLGRFKDMMKPYFWWSLGLDQMVHHLTHYFIIYKLVTYTS